VCWWRGLMSGECGGWCFRVVCGADSHSMDRHPLEAALNAQAPPADLVAVLEKELQAHNFSVVARQLSTCCHQVRVRTIGVLPPLVTHTRGRHAPWRVPLTSCSCAAVVRQCAGAGCARFGGLRA
jgi:hypothetical protein